MREHTVLKVVLALIIIVFLGAQIYASVYNPITTQSAQFETATDGLQITGYVIRKETVIKNSSSGTLHFLISDGERVAKGGTLADIYNSDSASLTVNKIVSLNERIKDFEEIEAYNNVQAPDIALANTKVNTALCELIYNSGAGNYSAFLSDSNDLISAVNRRQAITGEQTDFSGQLSELKSQLSELNSSLPSPIGSVKSGLSGYFVSSVDGYEDVLLPDKLDQITPDFLDNIKSQKPSDDAIGKVVSDYEWYIAAKVKINDSLKYKQGDSLKINTGIKASPVLNVTVKQINISASGGDAVIIFACSQMNSKLAGMRSGNMTVITKQYSGLKVSKDALRVMDGKTTGVYVVSGLTVKFVKVDIIYRNEDYIICKQEQSNENVLRIYDEVIVKGKNLYDGKVID